MAKLLEAEVAVITGAARGIGLATVQLFLDEGASVVISDVLDDAGQAAVASLAEDGRPIAYLHCDVTRIGYIEQMVCLGVLMGLPFRQRRRCGGEAFGQAFALRDVEHSEPLEKWDSAHGIGIAVTASLLMLTLGGEAVGIKYGLPALAFADASTRRQSLPKGQPILAGIAAFDDRTPKEQDIDP
jgi:hypothetical protein